MHPSAAVKKIDLAEVMAVSDRLNSLLLEESTLLATMKLGALMPLQQEKIALSIKLQGFHRALASGEATVLDNDPDAHERLYHVATTLAANIEENMRLTGIAQNVNRRVMQTFVEALAEQERVHVYSGHGAQDQQTNVTISLNINERA